jgi:phospholipid/cholesterol/gamma-HCH transport system substrate-binding protein
VQRVMRCPRSPGFWGIVSLVMLLVVSLGTAMIYVKPPGQQTVTFYTDDAVSVHAGDTVRIAGIIVGKVKDLSLEPDQVRVRLSVDDTAFVGDQSQVQVRMLTVVGGYYVTINSLGDKPLGHLPIPLERVTMPYSLIRTLADATKITTRVAPQPINDSLNQIQQGLTGSNTDVLTQLVNAGNEITTNLERQRGQVSSILALSNEYIGSLDANRDLLEFIISRVAILEQTLVLYGDGFAGAIEGMGNVLHRLEAVTNFYMPHRQDFLNKVRGILGELQTVADRNGVLVRVLRRIRERSERTLEAQNNSTRPELFATDLCIPLEGSRC